MLVGRAAFFTEAHEKISIFSQLRQPLCRSQSPVFCHTVPCQELLNLENATSYISIISLVHRHTSWLHRLCGGRIGLPPDGLSWMLWNEMRCPCLRVIFSTSGLDLVKHFLLSVWSHASLCSIPFCERWISFIKCLLCSYYVPGSMLCAGSTEASSLLWWNDGGERAHKGGVVTFTWGKASSEFWLWAVSWRMNGINGGRGRWMSDTKRGHSRLMEQNEWRHRELEMAQQGFPTKREQSKVWTGEPDQGQIKKGLTCQTRDGPIFVL